MKNDELEILIATHSFNLDTANGESKSVISVEDVREYFSEKASTKKRNSVGTVFISPHGAVRFEKTKGVDLGYGSYPVYLDPLPNLANKAGCQEIENPAQLKFVAPDYSLLSCAKCGSCDVGGVLNIVQCYSCKQKVEAAGKNHASIEDWATDSVLAWNTLQVKIAHLSATESKKINSSQKPL